MFTNNNNTGIKVVLFSFDNNLNKCNHTNHNIYENIISYFDKLV